VAAASASGIIPLTPGTIHFNTATGLYEVLGSHVYNLPGQYTVTILIRDAGGASTRVTAIATVLATPAVDPTAG